MIGTCAAPTGALVSGKYEVFVGENRQAVPVYLTLCSDGTGEIPLPRELSATYNAIGRTVRTQKAYFCGFEADCETKITVVFHGTADSFEVLDKPFEIQNQILTFTMEPDEKVLVKVGKGFGDHLCLSCDKPYEVVKDKEHFIEFLPGYHTTRNCDFIHINDDGFPVITDIPDHSVVYLHPGAVVVAAVILENKHDIRICGEGIFSTIEYCYGADSGFACEPLYGPLKENTPPSIYIKTNSDNIEIENVTLSCVFRGVVVRNSEDIRVTNVKIYTNVINADGVSMINTRRMKVKGCFIFSQDDCIAVFTSCDSILFLGDPECTNPLPVSSDIEISDCFNFTACRAFCIGGHSTGAMNPRNLLENFYAHDINANCYRYYPVPDEARVAKWSGALRVLSQTEQYVRNITFRDIQFREREDYDGKLIHIEVRSSSNASYTERGGYRIENVLIENVRIGKHPDEILPCAIISAADGKEEDYGIHGVKICHVSAAGDIFRDSPVFFRKEGVISDFSVKNCHEGMILNGEKTKQTY